MTELASQVDPAEGYREFVTDALPRYGFGPQTRVDLLNVSENGTYRLTDGGHTAILRVHRIDYHSKRAIESELAWLSAVRTDTDIRTPTPIPSGSGEVVIDVHAGDKQRHAVLFESLPGREPQIDDLVARFADLGRITATLHDHAQKWQLPAEFTRFAWDWQHTLGTTPRWGQVSDGVGVGSAEAELLGRTAAKIGQQLHALGTSADSFGLIHADLRLANLLVEGDDLYVIDFDDCGFGWNLYDLGSAVSFLEDHPAIGEWCASWLDGYRSVRHLPAEQEAQVDTFIMLRRLLLVAWIGSHSSTDLARDMGIAYTAGSCVLAERYLSGLSLR